MSKLNTLSDAQGAEIARIYLETKLSIDRIADELNLDRNMIRRILLRQGVKIRTNNKLTPDQEQEIVQLYLSGSTTEELTEIYPVNSKQSICNTLIKHGVRRRANEDYKRTRHFNEQAFDTIDNEDAAYWLGFLYADGYTDGMRIDVTLSAVDTRHLEKLNEFLESDYPIYNIEPRDGDGSKARLPMCSRYMAAQLMRLGIVVHRNHFHLTYAGLPPHLYNHFLRGLLDGDGWYFVDNRITWTDVVVGVCGQDDLLLFTRQVFSENAGTNPNIKIAKMSGINKISYSGVQQAKRVIRYLYQDATIYLDRKAETVQKILAIRPKERDPG